MNSVLKQNLQAVFNTFDAGVLVENSERKVQVANQRFMDIFGLPGLPDDMPGYDCTEAAQQVKELMKEPELFVQDVIEIITDGVPRKDMVPFADGRFFIRKYTPVYDNGELCCHVWNYEEVTSLKDKENELLKQREFFNKILNELPADIAIFSAGHRYMYLNKTAVKSDGIRNWMIGKDDYEYCEMRGLDKSVADERRAKFNQAKETREAVTWIDELETEEGKVNYVLRIFYPYINSADELEFVIGYGVNINHQKEGERVLAQEKERFSTLIETLRDGVFQMTFDGKIQFFNESFLKAMGLPQGMDISGQYNKAVMANVYPEDKSALYAAFDRLNETQEPQEGMFRMIHPGTGTTSFIEYYIWHRYTDADGHIAAGRLSDVTEREQREQRMQNLIAKEKELNNLKSHFIHITSHELRTPLSVIMSSAEILEMCDGQDAETLAMVDTPSLTGGIVREVNRITDILNELLMVGRIESGKIKFEPVATNIPDYINNLADEMYAPHTDGRTLKVNIADDVTEVKMDRSLMRHAITNLVNNAFKYSADKPAPELNVYRTGNDLKIEVKDHGIGIPEEELDNLFTSFYRASNVGNISGTGIGLMVVEHVMKTHNGTINIKSKPGEGSVFTLSVPCR